jgi:RNA:NAD 2'-phosphotransferase (TPT1/KptA family)
MNLVRPKPNTEVAQTELKKLAVRPRQILQQLKYLLRHAENTNLWISNGWFKIDDVLDYLNYERHHRASKITIQDLKNIIQSDILKIFELKNGKIRAVCGHSFSTSLILPHHYITPPQFLYIAETHMTTSIWLNKGIDFISNKDVILYNEPEIAYYNATKPVGLNDDFIRTMIVDTYTLADFCNTQFRTIDSEKVFLTEFVHQVGLSVYKECRLFKHERSRAKILL